MKTPDQIYGELFKEVQMAQVFPDSKTFVDCTPKSDPEAIIEHYRIARGGPHFDLGHFVMEHFTLPGSRAIDFTADPSRPVEEHIELLWDILTRDADREIEGSSLISLPHPYVVPGGRFGEIYYWDSYFTMLGLEASGKISLIESMVDNFAHLIHTQGFIPNGNRSYFLSRSQPPFFALMVRLLSEAKGDKAVCQTYLSALEGEYHFWMDGAEGSQSAYRRCVHLDAGVILNRYWDDQPAPRPESYREDVVMARRAGRTNEHLYRDLRAACESGWDFSTRWCAGEDDLENIRTTELIPVDLNCLLYLLEKQISMAYQSAGQDASAARFTRLADQRRKAILEYCWDEESGAFDDYMFTQKKVTGIPTLAMVFPLFAGIATEAQSEAIAQGLESHFLQPGGLLTTLRESGQQWDAPNGWAPLQWIAIQGLRNYGYDELSGRIKNQWCDNCIRVYRTTGKLVEKYNVSDITLAAGGGEYPVQDGFGWTNGVLLKLLKES